MTKQDWESGNRIVAMFLNGEEIASPDEKGERILDESFLLFFNAEHEDCTFRLPNRRFGARWSLVLTTADPGAEPNSLEVAAADELVVPSRSVILLRRK
jgi:glycogen operon protein